MFIFRNVVLCFTGSFYIPLDVPCLYSLLSLFFPISRLIWTFSSLSANQHSVPVFSILTFSMFPCSIFMFFVIRFPPFCSFLFRSPSSCSLLFFLHLLVLHVCVFSVLMFSIIFSIFHLPHLCCSSLGSPSLCSLSLGRLLWWESSWSMCSSFFCSPHLVCFPSLCSPPSFPGSSCCIFYLSIFSVLLFFFFMIFPSSSDPWTIDLLILRRSGWSPVVLLFSSFWLFFFPSPSSSVWVNLLHECQWFPVNVAAVIR